MNEIKNEDFLSNVEREEYILCAALYYDDGIKRVHQPKNIDTGLVICGRRHHNCFNILFQIFKDISKKSLVKQGFLSSKDRFLDRKTAAIVALNSKQIYKKTKSLFSEDLY